MNPAWPILAHETLDSTSDEARRLVEAGGQALPFVVVAEHQTKGRGRGSNAWWSDEGSLLFTVALEPSAFGLEVRHEPRLALVAALALIEAAGLPLGIRWPNDVEFQGRKVAGILPERVETAGGVRLLIGVGVNVTTRFDEAPGDVRGMATSLVEVANALPPTLTLPRKGGGDQREPSPLAGEGRVGGGACARTALLAAFLDAFPPLLDSLAADDETLPKRWQARDQLLGQAVRIQQLDRILAGTARGIDADGALLVETDGGLETITGGQVLRP